jgi:hypothetical protein
MTKDNLPLMPMANKTPEMKEAIESLFPGTAKAIDEHKCPMCKASIDPQSFRDRLSRREWGISGLCQNCQDKMFGKGGNGE